MPLSFAHFFRAALAPFLRSQLVTQQRHSKPVRPMPDEDFFGVLRLVMPKVKEMEEALSLSDGRPGYAAVRRREP
jgi:hypothetical protein